MNDLIKREGKKGELLYLDGIENIHMKHMQLLSDLLKRPTLRTEIPNVNNTNDIYPNKMVFHTELELPPMKQRKLPKEKTE